MTSTVTHPTCTYDSGAEFDCVPLCSESATHKVIHRNGTYGPFETLVCRRHVRPMEGRVFPGHIRTDPIDPTTAGQA